MARLHIDRWADFSAIGLVALPVPVEGDVEVCRLLPGVVLSEIGGTPAHHAPSQIRHTPEPTWRWGIAPTDDPDHKRACYTRFKRSFGGQVKEYAGMSDLLSMP